MMDADERARLRALAMRAGDGDESANDELCEYLFGSEHGLLALLDAADRAEQLETALDEHISDTLMKLSAERARAERLEAALKFYAEREHLYGSLGEDWDTCSDVEYAGWLLPPDPVSDESWGVEDGSTARAALAALADPAPAQEVKP